MADDASGGQGEITCDIQSQIRLPPRSPNPCGPMVSVGKSGGGNRRQPECAIGVHTQPAGSHLPFDGNAIPQKFLVLSSWPTNSIA